MEKGESHLVTPFINDGHVDVVNKDSHSLPGWRSIGVTYTLVNVALNGPL